MSFIGASSFQRGPNQPNSTALDRTNSMNLTTTNESFQALVNQSMNMDKSIEYTTRTEDEYEGYHKDPYSISNKTYFSHTNSQPQSIYNNNSAGNIKKGYSEPKGIIVNTLAGKLRNKANEEVEKDRKENEEETQPMSPSKPRKRTVSFGTSVEVFNLDEEPSRLNVFNSRPELKVAFREASPENKKRNLYGNGNLEFGQPLPDIQDYENEEDIHDHQNPSSEENDQSYYEGVESNIDNINHIGQNNDIIVPIGEVNREGQANPDASAAHIEAQMQRLNEFLQKMAKFKFRRTMVFCLAILLISILSELLLEKKNNWSRRVLFLTGYIFLGYYLVENFIQAYKKDILSWKRLEDIFHILDILYLIFFIALIDFKLAGFEIIAKFGCIPPIITVIIYFCKSSAPKALKESKTILRVLFGLELFFIGGKIDGDIDWPWKTITSLLWLYLTLVCIYCLLMVITLLCVIGLSFFKLTMYESVSTKVQVTGFLWSSLYSGFGAVGFGTLVGISSAFDGDNDQTLLKNSILAWRFLSLFLIIFTLVTYRWIMEFLTKFNFEEAYYREELGLSRDESIPQVITEKKDVYLVMLSSTYFLPLKNSFLVRKEKLRKLRRNFKTAKDKRYKSKSGKALDLPLQKIRKAPVDIESLKKDKENLDEVFGKQAIKIHLVQPAQSQSHEFNEIKEIKETNELAVPRSRGMSMGNLNTLTLKRKMSSMSNLQNSPVKMCLSEGDDGPSIYGSPALSYKKDDRDQLCYICCERPPNAVIGECGHGGICSECAVEAIKAKGKCMECRSEAEKVIKIDPDLRLKNIIKGYETLTIIPAKQTAEES